MAEKEVLYDLEGPIAIVTLNRPARMNALTLAAHRELADAIEQADRDERIRAIVITGAGKGFCSGDDVGDVFLSPEEDAFKTREARLRQIQGEHPFPGGGHRLLAINKPSIAAVNGPAVGYGCELALLCNMRVASERARFSEIFLRVGLMPDEGLLILPRLIGLAKTYEMVLTTDFVDAREAERIGLVNKVVPHEELMPATLELCRKIAAKPPVATRLAMEGIRRGLGWPLESFMRYQAVASPFCAETEDHKEGARAFLEKRDPVFKGR
ncbi:MAG: enoyl-CoA hydratase-related protein [bacterium]